MDIGGFEFTHEELGPEKSDFWLLMLSVLLSIILFSFSVETNFPNTSLLNGASTVITLFVFLYLYKRFKPKISDEKRSIRVTLILVFLIVSLGLVSVFPGNTVLVSEAIVGFQESDQSPTLTVTSETWGKVPLDRDGPSLRDFRIDSKKLDYSNRTIILKPNIGTVKVYGEVKDVTIELYLFSQNGEVEKKLGTVYENGSTSPISGVDSEINEDNSILAERDDGVDDKEKVHLILKRSKTKVDLDKGEEEVCVVSSYINVRVVYSVETWLGDSIRVEHTAVIPEERIGENKLGTGPSLKTCV